MNLLAIDTSAEDCSVGVVAAGAPPVLLSETLGRGHAERIAGMIATAMSAAGLSFAGLGRIAVTIGPGSFTGVRVGIAAGRGIALVVGCPVVGIGSLDALAEGARSIAGARSALAVLDARRDEVYAAAFTANGAALGRPVVVSPADAAALLQPDMVLAGSGAGLVATASGVAPERIAHRRSSPDIADVVRLALLAPRPTSPPRPLYLRAPDAKPQGGRAVARL